MRISDWSSDVCSSDLQVPRVAVPVLVHAAPSSVVGAPSSYGLPPALVPPAGRRWMPRSIRHPRARPVAGRSEEHTSELQSLMRISYAVFCLKKKTQPPTTTQHT